jgi:hypothetical protein
VRIGERKCEDVTSRLRFGPISVTSVPFRMTQTKKGVLPGLARRTPALATPRDPDFSTAVRINCFSRPPGKRSSRRCTARALDDLRRWWLSSQSRDSRSRSAFCVQALHKHSLRQRFAACRFSVRTNHLQQEQSIAPPFGQLASVPAVMKSVFCAHTRLLSKELCQVTSPKRGGFGPILFGFTTGLRK